MGKLIDRCWEFPNCRCWRGLLAYEEKIEEWANHPDYPKNFSLEDITTLIFMDYFRLRCIAANASSHKWRSIASQLLTHPLYKHLWRQYP